MSSSDDFKKALRAGNLAEALVIAMSQVIELKITTSVISSTDPQPPQPGDWAKPTAEGNRICTRINLIEGEIHNEVGENFISNRLYKEIEQFHLQQVAQSNRIIENNLESLQKLFQFLAILKQEKPHIGDQQLLSVQPSETTFVPESIPLASLKPSNSPGKEQTGFLSSSFPKKPKSPKKAKSSSVSKVATNHRQGKADITSFSEPSFAELSSPPKNKNTQKNRHQIQESASISDASISDAEISAFPQEKQSFPEESNFTIEPIDIGELEEESHGNLDNIELPETELPELQEQKSWLNLNQQTSQGIPLTNTKPKKETPLNKAQDKKLQQDTERIAQKNIAKFRQNSLEQDTQDDWLNLSEQEVSLSPSDLAVGSYSVSRKPEPEIWDDWAIDEENLSEELLNLNQNQGNMLHNQKPENDTLQDTLQVDNLIESLSEGDIFEQELFEDYEDYEIFNRITDLTLDYLDYEEKDYEEKPPKKN